MKTAIIIHGYFTKEEFFDVTRPSPSNDHWFPWIQKQLLLNGILTQTPEMPSSYAPEYENRQVSRTVVYFDRVIYHVSGQYHVENRLFFT